MLSAFRNFFITLLSALILLGLAGYMVTDFALGAMDPTKKPLETDPAVDSESSETPDPDNGQNPPSQIQSANESFNILLIGHDYQPDVFDDYVQAPLGDAFPSAPRRACADMLVLIRIDQKTKTVVFCNIPTNAKVTDMGLNTTLGELWGRYGSEYLVERVHSLIGMPVDYHVTISMPGLVRLVDEIGGITYRIEQDMYYYDPVENYKIELQAGVQKLNGNKVLQLLRFNGYEDDGTKRRETAVSVLKELIATVAADQNYYDNAHSIYRIMAEYVETDFTENDAARKLDLMFLYPEMTLNVIQYPGKTVIEQVYLPSSDIPEPSAPQVPGPPETSETPDTPGTSDPIPPSSDEPTFPSEDGELITIYRYELDIVTGRAIFSAYKYKG